MRGKYGEGESQGEGSNKIIGCKGREGKLPMGIIEEVRERKEQEEGQRG